MGPVLQKESGRSVKTAISPRLRGALCVIIAGYSWGFSGTCSQFFYANSDAPAIWLTCVRALAGGILPAAVTDALGLAIYGMFIAIILPPFRRSREVRVVILIAVAMSCLFALAPLFDFISDGFRIILCAVIASALGAWLMPQPVNDEEEEALE